MLKKESSNKSSANVLEKLVPALLIIAVGLAFAVGVLWQKVVNLENGGLGSRVGSNKVDTSLDGDSPPNGKLSENQAKNIPEVTSADHIRGTLDAKIFLVEYSDLECPFCQKFHSTAQQAVDEYNGEVAWIYRHFPLSSIHAKAQKAAEGAECAAELGGEDAFWSFTSEAFKVAPAGLSDLPKIASTIGINQSEFESCLDSGRFESLVQDQYNGGTTAGVTGTPGSFILNDKGEAWTIPGAVPYETLKQVIDEALQS